MTANGAAGVSTDWIVTGLPLKFWSWTALLTLVPVGVGSLLSEKSTEPGDAVSPGPLPVPRSPNA